MSFLEAHPEAHGHFKPATTLAVLPYIIQAFLLVMCMYQALILTMLGRDVYLAFTSHSLEFVIVLIIMWLPTTIMSACVTPQVLRTYSIAASAVNARADIIDHMRAEVRARTSPAFSSHALRAEPFAFCGRPQPAAAPCTGSTRPAVCAVQFTEQGDYSAATQALEMLSRAKLSDQDKHDEALVRARVKDLTRLGEMKWRFRVVEEGHSPRDDAIEVLSEAKDLMDAHFKLRYRLPKYTQPGALSRVADADVSSSSVHVGDGDVWASQSLWLRCAALRDGAWTA
jgi:hypothetical protein